MPTPSGSESSLPTIPRPFLPSSPPVAIRTKRLHSEMDSNTQQTFKSEDDGAEALRDPIKRPSSTDTERPPSAQRPQLVVDEQSLSEKEEDSEDVEADPGEKIEDFNWDELSERYHKEIAKCEENEGALSEEFEDLMNFFRIWAASGHIQETNRTFSRHVRHHGTPYSSDPRSSFSTRISHVQNSEFELEKTRNHYNNVVKAFESAMNLLSNIR